MTDRPEITYENEHRATITAKACLTTTAPCEHLALPHDPYKGEAECGNCGARLISDGPGYDGEQTWTTA